MKNLRTGQDKTRQQGLDQPEGLSGQEDKIKERIRLRVKQMLSDSSAEQNKEPIIKGGTFFSMSNQVSSLFL